METQKLKNHGLLNNAEPLRTVEVCKFRDYRARIIVVRYPRRFWKPRLVVFDEATKLQDWCLENGATEAISGGFFDREEQRPLGELWLDGAKASHSSFRAPYSNSRGSILMSGANQTIIAPRTMLPERPQGSLLQAGPLLVRDGFNMAKNNLNIEGFSSGSSQFDADITNGRYPRAAVALNAEYFFTVAVEGYNNFSRGITLTDFADYLIMIGADHALNLDGGGSANLISASKLINEPRSLTSDYPVCRPIYSAIVIEKTTL